MENPLNSIHRICSAHPVERIYLHEYEYGDVKFKEFLILLQAKSSIFPMEALPIANMMLQEDASDYECRVLRIEEVRHALNQGSLVFSRICREKNLIYCDQLADDLGKHRMKPGKAIEKAHQFLEKESKRIAGFSEGSYFYAKRRNYPMAALMLHQMMEISYRTAELFVLGKEKVTHTIRSHQRLMKRYLPELSQVFNDEVEEDQALLELLDRSYKAVRYEEDYEISEEEIDLLHVKAKKLSRILGKRYDALIWQFHDQFEEEFDEFVAKEFEKKFGEPFEEKSCGDNSAPSPSPDLGNREKQLQDIIEKIKELLPEVMLIYQLGHNRGVYVREGLEEIESHFESQYALLIAIDRPLSDFHQSLEARLNEGSSIKVLLLIHTVDEVQEALSANNRFFHEVLRKAPLLYSKLGERNVFSLPDYDASKEKGTKQSIRYSRGERMKTLFHAASEIPQSSSTVMASLLYDALEQVCLAYIELAIGYRPGNQSLKHLIEICRYISSEIDGVFPTSCKEDRRLLDNLIQGSADMRLDISASADLSDLWLLQRRLEDWMSFVKERFA